jgi:hypothetical protein
VGCPSGPEIDVARSLKESYTDRCSPYSILYGSDTWLREKRSRHWLKIVEKVSRGRMCDFLLAVDLGYA